MSIGRSLLSALSVIVSIVFAVISAAQPATGLLAVAWMIGVYAIVIGITSIVVYFETRSAVHSLA